MARTVMKIELTLQEVNRLHDEIGDIPKSRVGPKLLALWHRLDNLVNAHELTESEDPEKLRKKVN